MIPAQINALLLGASPGPVPVNTALPIISGVTTLGQELEVSDGSWTGDTEPFAYQWLRDGVIIAGASSNTYVLEEDDVGTMIGAIVYGENLFGIVEAAADEVGPIDDLVVPGDPSFSDIVLLMGFEGADGATGAPGMNDESLSAHGTASVYGNAQIDTSQFKFGGASLLCDGDGDTIQFADSVDWQLSTANADEFTVEVWVRSTTATPTSKYILWQSGGIGAIAWWLGINADTQLEFRATTDGINAWNVCPTSVALTWTANTWYHLACDKDATGKARIYRNGVMVGSATPVDSKIANANIPLAIGGDPIVANRCWPGWIDEVRITKGDARYASDTGFTVPSAAYPRPVTEPTDILLSASTLEEGSVQGTTIGTLSAIGGSVPITFSLVDSAGSRFQITGTTLEAGPVATDYGTATSHNITVRATDSLSETYDEVFVIAVTEAEVEGVLPLTGLTGAWSFSRDLVAAWGGAPRYTESSGKIDALKDQAGASRDFLQTTVARRPVVGTAGPFSRACGVFNSTDITYLSTVGGDPLSDFITAGAGYMVVSFMGTTINANTTPVYANEGIICDVSQFVGLFCKASPTSLHVYNWDGSVDTTSTPITEDVIYVAEWRHDGGNIYCRINGGTEVSVASGNTTNLGGPLRIGAGPTGSSGSALDGVIFEVATYSTVPNLATRDAIVASFFDWVTEEVLGDFAVVDSDSADIAASTSHTFTAMDFGPADGSRKLIALIMSEGASANHQISAVTIGGVAATIDNCQFTSGEGTQATVAHVDLPAGTSGDVAIVTNNNMDTVYCHLWRAIGYAPLGVGGDDVSTSTVLSGLVDLDDNCTCIIGAVCNATPTITLTGYDDELFNAPVGGTKYAVAVKESVVQTEDHAVTATFSGAASGMLILSPWTKNVPAEGSPWLPLAELPTLRGLYDMDLIGGVDGAALATLPDQSIWNHDGVQATGGNQPNLEVAELNGLDVVSFNGTSDFFSLPDMFSGWKRGSLIAVIKGNSDPGVGTAGSPQHIGNASADHYPYTDGIIYDGAFSSTRKTTGNATVALNTWHILVITSAPNAWTMWINGVQHYTTATNAFGNLSTPVLGSGGAAVFWGGMTAYEAFAREAWDTETRQKFEGYIAHKCGIESVLDVSHPYKDAPPGYVAVERLLEDATVRTLEDTTPRILED